MVALKNKFLYKIKNIVLIVIGIVTAAFGLEAFLIPNSFIDGGVTGISLLLTEAFDLPLSLFLVIINLPFIILAYFQIQKKFAYKSVLAIISLALIIHFFHFPIVTTDKVLIAAFGGFFLGLGIGLAMRGGAVLDGTEALAIVLSKKLNLKVGDIILVFNILIFTFATFILSIETALYATLTYIAASKTIDFIIEGIDEYIGITIISKRSDEIQFLIKDTMKRAITVYIAKRGYNKKSEELQHKDIIYVVMTRLEVRKFKQEIKEIDSSAFIIMNSIKDTEGGIVKKRPLK